MSNELQPILDQARAYLRIDVDQLARVADQLEPSFAEAVQTLSGRFAAGGKLVCGGIGKSYHIAAKVAATFTSTGSPAVLLHPAEAPHGDLGILRNGDCVLLLSYSGETKEVVQLVPLLRRLDVRIISITGSKENRLARLADHALCVNIEREACPFNLAPTTSALVTLAVCDTLAMLTQARLGFTREEYRLLHPAGAIGESLQLKVSDIMRTGDRLPVCHPTDSVREAVLAMTRHKAGAVAVVDAQSRLLGVYTDGDLRRSLSRTDDLGKALLVDHMTAKPITLSSSSKATDALTLFSRHNIDDLLVVDGDNRLVGLVDLQDIPKLKFFGDA
jgi:arabinose-5-phosphate isomerase